MTNLTLLQRVCEQVNIERPTANLSALTVEQQQLLRFLDEQHIELCGKKDWWFLQRTGDLSLWPYASGPTATLVVSSNPKVVTIAAAPFNFAQTLTTNGKLTLAGATG